MHYYLARELAHRLEINLAKWKRWSREFLPPDPLGGLQSGFARQYSIKEAFLVSLGGFLVGELKFAVPEARMVLHDLGPWLTKAGYLRPRTNSQRTLKKPQEDHHPLIFVRPEHEKGGGYLYWVTALQPSLQGGGAGVGLDNDLDAAAFFNLPGVRVINLGGFIKRFEKRLA